LYEFIIKETGYFDFLRDSEDDFNDRIENLKELGSFIAKFEEEKGSDATLKLFLEEIALISDSSVNENEDKGYVTLMTIHASKGLEFPEVFLPGFEEGIFPSQQCIYDDDIEEERRLAYVAITRAKEYVCILNSTSRMTFGSTSHNKPSRFISEIPSDLINVTKSREWKKMPAGQHIPKSIKDIKIKSVVSARSFGMNALGSNLMNSDKKKYILGDVVNHNIFGHGVVTSVYDIGNDSLLEIDFEKSGKKKIPMSRL
jgi:DNA helicase-2/ATP-dependent DNA helicase PcrA